MINFMKQIEKRIGALESSVSFIRDNHHELTNYMRTLLLSLGLKPFHG
jgi:hypothetical protein